MLKFYAVSGRTSRAICQTDFYKANAFDERGIQEMRHNFTEKICTVSKFQAMAKVNWATTFVECGKNIIIQTFSFDYLILLTWCESKF